jgi:hypothetical protein
MNKVYIGILVVLFSAIAVDAYFVAKRDRSKSPTWEEIERAYKFGRLTQSGHHDQK